jgi:putative ABC transport system substrate-binding protein
MHRRQFVLGSALSLMSAARVAHAQTSPGLDAIVVGVLGNGAGPVWPMSFGATSVAKLEAEIGALTKPASGRRIRFVHGQANDPAQWKAQAQSLLLLRAAVIVAVGTPATMAAGEATKTVPIVMVGAADPVALGLVRSLGRPGGNITGVSLLGPEMLEKSLDLLLEAAPWIKRPAVLWNASNPGAALSLRRMEEVATGRRVNLVSVAVDDPSSVDRMLTDLTQLHHDALILVHDPVFIPRADRILTYCKEYGLPAMFTTAEWVTRGGFMSYEPEAGQMYRRAAAYVSRVLQGTHPRDLPIEQPTRFWLSINARTAKALGLAVPESLLLRADQVIE